LSQSSQFGRISSTASSLRKRTPTGAARKIYEYTPFSATGLPGNKSASDAVSLVTRKPSLFNADEVSTNYSTRCVGDWFVAGDIGLVEKRDIAIVGFA